MRRQIQIDKRNALYDTIFWGVISLATCGAGFVAWVVMELILKVVGV